MINLEDYPFINVKIEAYFRVRNSETWGGKGSVGYMRMQFQGVKNLQGCLTEEFIRDWQQKIVKQHHVTSHDVDFITQDEYEAVTKNETDEPLSITYYKDENRPVDVSMPQSLYDKFQKTTDE